MHPIRRLALTVGMMTLAAASQALAGVPAAPSMVHLDANHMMGRWYEVARLPNRIQRDCQGGTSDWAKADGGYSVLQSCHKGSLSAAATEWKAKARVLDPATNARLKMTFFGGLLSQEYWVLDNRPDQGWLVLGTPSGHALWLMAKHPSLAVGVKAQAVARIRQLGYDVAALEFPQPARN